MSIPFNRLDMAGMMLCRIAQVRANGDVFGERPTWPCRYTIPC